MPFMSLFSGAGGLDMGFSMSGQFNLVLANDILASPAKSYPRSFGHEIVDVDTFKSVQKGKSVFVLGGVSKIVFRRVVKDYVDLIVG